MQCIPSLFVLLLTMFFIVDQARTIILIHASPALGRLWLRIPLASLILLMQVMVALALLCRIARLVMSPA